MTVSGSFFAVPAGFSKKNNRGKNFSNAIAIAFENFQTR